MVHYVVFDLETVPDLDAARRLLGSGPEVPDAEVRRQIGLRYARDGEAPETAFLKPPLHRIVCLGALYAEREAEGPFQVRRLGGRHTGERGEAELVRDFLANLPSNHAGQGPVLVTFNGSGFDMIVLRYRAMAHGLAVPSLLAKGPRDYWYRFGWDHIDLCDLLSGFGASARPSLSEMAALIGVPGKLDGVDGSQVEAMAGAGRLDEVAAYCLGDVIVTYRLLLRFALARGEIDHAGFDASEASLEQAIERHTERWPALGGLLRGRGS